MTPSFTTSSSTYPAREGIRLSSHGAYRFAHNSAVSFQGLPGRRLAKASAHHLGDVFVLLESLYSMDGAFLSVEGDCRDRGGARARWTCAHCRGRSSHVGRIWTQQDVPWFERSHSYQGPHVWRRMGFPRRYELFVDGDMHSEN